MQNFDYYRRFKSERCKIIRTLTNDKKTVTLFYMSSCHCQDPAYTYIHYTGLHTKNETVKTTSNS